jgi:hypothetical protein
MKSKEEINKAIDALSCDREKVRALVEAVTGLVLVEPQSGCVYEYGGHKYHMVEYRKRWIAVRTDSGLADQSVEGFWDEKIKSGSMKLISKSNKYYEDKYGF